MLFMTFTTTLNALADENRQKIIELLKKRDLSVNQILAHFDIAGASLSHHLTILKNTGLISSRRQGKYIVYSLNLSVVEELISKLSKLYKN